MKTNKKLITLILVILIPFLIFLYFYTRDYEYTKEYKVGKVNVRENYDEVNKNYKYVLTYKDVDYKYIIENKYINKRQLISDIKLEEDKDEICLLPDSPYLNFYPLCSSNGNLISYNISNKKLKFNYDYTKEVNDKFEDVEIYNYYDKTFLINNYYGFYYLGNKENKNINLFKEDNYNMNLVYKMNEYLLVADYDNNNLFDKFYVINTNNGKYDELKTENKLSFTTRFLGDYKNKIYFVDPKEEQEYIIDIKKNKITETSGLIYDGKKMVAKDIDRIIKKKLSFNKNKRYHYEVVDNKLYQIVDNDKILLSNQQIKDIIYNDDEDIYYLVNDTLYVYSHYYGEVKLMKYFEWNFNYKDKIYIF